MLTLRDHTTASLFDPWEHLGPKRRQLLQRSWAGVFRDYLLRHLPVGELSSHFCSGFGRPSKDLHMVLGALILQQLHDLTDAQTVEAVAFNITWHYALDNRHEADSYVCERSLRNYRRLLIDKGLDETLFRTLTDALIETVGVDTRKQRLDSTAVRSFMRSHTRLGILVETTSKFLRELRRMHPDLIEKVDAALWRRYIDRAGYFARTTPGESKRRLPEVAADLYALLENFNGTAAASLESFSLLAQVFEEQCELGKTDGKSVSVRLKEPKAIPCDNILSPADPDASYNTHRGVGYLVQVMESYPGEQTSELPTDADARTQAPDYAAPTERDYVSTPGLITHVSVGKMNVHDSAALIPALEDVAAREIGPELLTADTHYGSNDCIKGARARGTVLVAPSMPPKGSKQGWLTLEDFELNEAGEILSCPQGHAPLETSAGRKRLQARFKASVCGVCSLRSRCIAAGKERLQYTLERVRQRRRRLAEKDLYFKEHYRWRAGVEAAMSHLKQMGLDRLRVRGKPAVQYRVLLRALGLNIHRVARWRQYRMAAA